MLMCKVVGYFGTRVNSDTSCSIFWQRIVIGHWYILSLHSYKNNTKILKWYWIHQVQKVQNIPRICWRSCYNGNKKNSCTIKNSPPMEPKIMWYFLWYFLHRKNYELKIYIAYPSPRFIEPSLYMHSITISTVSPVHCRVIDLYINSPFGHSM